MVCGYADVVVLRHRRDGAARFAARYATVPLINAGDGAHEHPTQTLCDLFTILCERGSLNNLTVALLGDLKGGRTAHSLAYALARYGANLVCMPAKGLDLPEHVASTLRASFGYRYVEANCAGRGYDRMTGVFVPQDADTPALDAIDVLYVTRFQKERATETAADYPTVNAAFLAPDGFRNTLVLHPLPRVGELDPKFDADARAGYFRQACYGVPVRMALLTYLLKTKGDNILSNPHHDAENEHRGIACGNPNCISHDSNEPEATPRLAPSRDQPSRLRCLYCDQETPTA
jgi:aspartate carbamoyltransferase catalytic subunit